MLQPKYIERQNEFTKKKKKKKKRAYNMLPT